MNVYPTRQAEMDGVADAIRALVKEQKVFPSDILVLFKSHYPFKELAGKLKAAIGPAFNIREVDARHRSNKNHPLIEDGCLTVSNIASAKGYDAPIAFLVGTDELATDSQGRASFYVGATRAKLSLCVSGIQRAQPSLLDEIVIASRSLGNCGAGEPAHGMLISKAADSPAGAVAAPSE